MKDSEKLILGIIVLYIILAAIFGSFLPWEWPFFKKAEVVPTGAAVAGLFDVEAKGYNSLDVTTAYTENTHFHCYWYAFRGGWMMLGKGQTTVEVIQQDMGFLYAVVKVNTASHSLYVDWAETKAKNPRVDSVTFEDVDNDGYRDFVFRLNLANIPKPSIGNPKVIFYPYFLAYEKPSINAPADLTGVGTAKTVKYIEHYLYFATVRKAFAIIKLEITVNTTDTSKINIKSVAMPFGGSISGEMLGQPVKGVNTLTWTYTFGNNLYNAVFVKYPVNVMNKFYSTSELEIDLEAGDKINYTITWTGLTVDGSLTTITDTVLITA